MAKKETEKKIVKKPVKKTKTTKKQEQKQGYLKQVKVEMKKVSWPEKKEVIKYSLATVVFCLIICGFFQLLNLVLSIIKGMFA